MAKKLLLLTMALLALLSANAATGYGIYIAGTEITSDNYNNVTDSEILQGTVSYNPSTKVVTFNNVNIVCTALNDWAEQCVRNAYDDNSTGLTLRFVGQNKLTSPNDGILVGNNTTIEIQGSLDITTDATGIHFDATSGMIGYIGLTLLITGPGTLNINAQKCAVEEKNADNTLKFQSVIATLYGKQGAIVDWEHMVFYADSHVTLKGTQSTDYPIVKNVDNVTYLDREAALTPYRVMFNTDKNTFVLSTYPDEPLYHGNILISDDYVALINASYFPDSKLRAKLLEYFPKGYINSTDVDNCTSLYLSNQGIRNFTGLNYLSKVKDLDLSKNSAEEINLSGFSQLETLNVSGNNSTSTISISSCPKLTALDVSSLTALTTLNCVKTGITSLNTTDCNALQTIKCQLCDFETLKITNLLNLKTLDLGSNCKLKMLSCNTNPNLDSLEVRGCSELMMLVCSQTALSSLNLSQNTKLQWLMCNECRFANLDLSNQAQLSYLACNSNQFTTLPVSTTNNPNLETIECKNNPLYSPLTISGFTKLQSINASNNSIVRLDCHANALTTLYVDGCDNLIEINCATNNFEYLNIKSLPNLKRLNCNNNYNLLNLNCEDNALTELQLSQCGKLKVLNASNNKFTTFTVVNRPDFESLDLSENANLTSVTCPNNALTVIDIEGCNALQYIECYNNKLTRLTLPTQATGMFAIDMTENNVNGRNAGDMVTSLPTVTNGVLYFRNEKPNATEANSMTAANVAAAQAKGWNVKVRMQNDDVAYYGEGVIPIDEAHFPDENFRNYLLAQDYGQDALLMPDEIQGITGLILNSKNIADLTGIEYFTQLLALQCYNNQIDSLDLSHNTLLTYLDAQGNDMSYLNINNCDSLGYIDASRNNLTEIDLSGKPKLWYANVYANQLTTLDLTGDDALQYLVCWGNQIKGEGLDAMIATLPATIIDGEFKFYNDKNASYSEGNQITAAQVAAAIEHGATPYRYNGSTWEPMTGSIKGDLNGDGDINAGDVTMLINMILGNTAIDLERGDLNNDGEINASDVTILTGLILS